jgi:hypothetical protein
MRPALREAPERSANRLPALAARDLVKSRKGFQKQGRRFKSWGEQNQSLGSEIQGFYFFQEFGLFKDLRSEFDGTRRCSRAPALPLRPCCGVWSLSWPVVARDARRRGSAWRSATPARSEARFRGGLAATSHVRPAVDLLALRRLADDLAHAARCHALLVCDILIGSARRRRAKMRSRRSALLQGSSGGRFGSASLSIACFAIWPPLAAIFWICSKTRLTAISN